MPPPSFDPRPRVPTEMYRVVLSGGLQDHHDLGSASKLFVNYAGLTRAVQVGSAILLDDGLVSLRVKDVGDEIVTCTIENR